MFSQMILVCGLLLSAEGQHTEIIVPKAIPEQNLARQVWDGYYRAELNTRYHSGYAASYRTWDFASRLVAIVLGAAAFTAPFLFGYRRRRAVICWTVVGFTALVSAVLLTVCDFPSSYQSHATAASRWCELANEWNGLRNERDTLSESQLQNKVHDLQARQTAIETFEPAGPNIPYLRECQVALNHSLGIKPQKPAPRNSALKTGLRR